jgi:hypothetical protein
VITVSVAPAAGAGSGVEKCCDSCLRAGRNGRIGGQRENISLNLGHRETIR